MQKYSIKEASKLIWLPESTLRYYEQMWLIDNIERDSSSKHRVYTDENIRFFSWIACLNATWMSIADMKKYIDWLKNEIILPKNQIELLKQQEEQIIQEQKELKIRKEYIKEKIKYWKFIDEKNIQKIEETKENILSISKKMKLKK